MNHVHIRITCAALAGSIALLLPASAHDPVVMDTVVVTGKAADLLGTAPAASVGALSTSVRSSKTTRCRASSRSS